MTVKDLLQPFVDRLVDKHPYAFKKALLKKNPRDFVQELSRWERQSYDNFKFSGDLSGFEDLVTLFSIGRFNRGIIRLELDEAALLYKTVSSINAPVGVEIGRGWGGSTLLLAIAVGEKGRIISIEIEPKYDQRLIKVLEQGGIRDRAELITGDSRKTQVNAPLDFAFIDACHDYDSAKNDHLTWGRQVKRGGCIIHHDLTDERPDASSTKHLLRLRDEILERQADCIEAQQQAGSLMVFRKTSNHWTAF